LTSKCDGIAVDVVDNPIAILTYSSIETEIGIDRDVEAGVKATASVLWGLYCSR
jgi:hypothetical protein